MCMYDLDLLIEAKNKANNLVGGEIIDFKIYPYHEGIGGIFLVYQKNDFMQHYRYKNKNELIDIIDKLLEEKNEQ